MTAEWFRRVGFLMVWFSALCAAQMPGFQPEPGEKMDTDQALDKALKSSSLTYQGKPFHAVMEIGAPGAEYSGRVEVWWVDEMKYRVSVRSPQFSQEKVVNGPLVSEKDTGDYYPRWLENFVLAILDPLPTLKNFQGHGGQVMVGPTLTRSCLRRDDRPGGITDQMTWGEVCFNGSEPKLGSVLATNLGIEYSDWKGFGKKKIARTISTDVLGFEPVVAKLTTLEEYKQLDQAMFVVSTATLPAQQIKTSYVSTLKEESMVEKAPTIEWPPVREGKTDGYMIVYARTDRTGQVRETAKHNSDQPGLESFGMQQALRYKFKPLMVDGVAQQMEMPLVLHFTSKLDNPVPILTVEQMKGQLVGCKNPGSGGTTVTMRVSVDETGKKTGVSATGKINGPQFMAAMRALDGCRYSPYEVDGKATYYKGDVEVKVP